MSLTTEYPLWLVLFCLLFATGGTWVLYRINPPGFSGKLTLWVLRIFRFVSLFLLSFLLLGPLVKIFLRKVEKPFIILAFDDSESIVANRDSSFYRKNLPLLFSKLRSELESDYDVRSYLLGKKLKPGSDLTFKEKQTDIASVFGEISNNYSNQNLGAVILATDGIYNEGNNPLYASRALRAPVFTIALGDTQQHKDLLIRNAKFNPLVYQGNLFPLRIDVSAFGCSGENIVLTVQHVPQKQASAGEAPVVFTRNLLISGQRFFNSLAVDLEAKEPGIQHYIIAVSKLAGEATWLNNRMDVFINVITGKRKILILAHEPHPDLSAYKQTIESNENYEVMLAYADNFNMRDLPPFDLAVLHQLPGQRGEGMMQIRQLKDKKVPLLYVLGTETGLNVLSSLEGSLSITANQANVNEALPVFNPSFSLFSMSEEEVNAVKKFPPLTVPYGAYSLKGEAGVLFRQQIGYVKTDIPLIFLSMSEGRKTGFVCGEGFWKWKLYDGLNGQQITQALAGKMIQYLAAKDDKSLFRIPNAKKRFDENEPVQFDAEVYNQSYELINSAEVQMVIRNAQGKTYNYTFSKTDKAYTLNAGMMPPGNYSYDASVSIGNKTEHLKGSFIVKPLQVEFLQTVADHQLLNQLSYQTEGKMFYPTQADEIISTIKKSERIKPVIYKQESVQSWINLKWLFFMILVLLSVEWFVRKWNGEI